MWSRKYNKCIQCGTTKEKHIARGLCVCCYRRDIENRHKDSLRNRGIAAKKLTKKYLIEHYCKQNKSLSDIAIECSCSRQYVYKKMLEYNIPLRSKRSARRMALKQKKIIVGRTDDAGQSHSVIYQKINYNEKFFTFWSPEMAYVLGVIYTDGCLNLRKNTWKSTIRRVPHLSIAQKEPELLRKMLALMNCNAKLHYRKRHKYGDKVAGAVYEFNFICTPIYPDLLRLGLKPKKSSDIEFPEVPKVYMRHFIRGCWDGDGSVYSEKRRKGYLIASYYSGSLKFIEGLLDEFERVGLSKRKIYEKKGKSSSYYFKYTGSNCIKLYHYLYDGVPPNQYLERKHALFKRFCDQQKGKKDKYTQISIF